MRNKIGMNNLHEEKLELTVEQKKGRVIDSLALVILLILVFLVWQFMVFPKEGEKYVLRIVWEWSVLFPDLTTGIIFAVCVVLSVFIIYEQGEKERDYIQLFPTLGMFGTFLGVALALKDLNITEINSAGLKPLIEGLKTAVYTTVYGMLFYIWWNFVFILKDRGKKDHSESATLEKILTEIKQFSENISSKMVDNIEGLMLELNQTIATTLGVELKDFSKTTQNLLDWYKTGISLYTKSTKEMSAISAKIEITLTELSNRIEYTTNALNTAFNEIAKTNDVLSRRTSLFKEQNEITQEWAEQVKNTGKSVAQMTENIKQSLSESQENFKNTIDSASAVAGDRIQSLSEGFRTYFIEVQKEVNRYFNISSEKRNAESARWEQAAEKYMQELKEKNEYYMTETLKEFAAQMEILAKNYHEHLETMLNQTSSKYTEGQTILQNSIEETGQFVKKTLTELSFAIDSKLTQEYVPYSPPALPMAEASSKPQQVRQKTVEDPKLKEVYLPEIIKAEGITPDYDPQLKIRKKESPLQPLLKEETQTDLSEKHSFFDWFSFDKKDKKE